MEKPTSEQAPTPESVTRRRKFPTRRDMVFYAIGGGVGVLGMGVGILKF